MPLQCVDELTEPPIVGILYLVPCVRGTWNGMMGDWPVIGPKHEDAKFIGFEAMHYHLDRRFLATRRTDRAARLPLQEYYIGDGITENKNLPPPTYRRRACRRSNPTPFPTVAAAKFLNFQTFYSHFSRRQCKRGAGWICPHKGFDLSVIKPGADGFISCPLHGLLINAETGVVANFEMPVARDD
jgi:hypothetical protein